MTCEKLNCYANVHGDCMAECMGTCPEPDPSRNIFEIKKSEFDEAWGQLMAKHDAEIRRKERERVLDILKAYFEGYGEAAENAGDEVTVFSTKQHLDLLESLRGEVQR